MFVAIGVVPSLKFPANPPTVGLEDTMGERSFGVLGDHGDLRRRRLHRGGRWAGPVARWGTSPAVGVAAGGYVAVMLCAMVPLPSFTKFPAR